MSDNVVKFRKIEKKPELPVKKPRGPMPSWLPFVAVIAIAVAIYLVRLTGFLG